jgi:hypothetical protein
VRRPVAWACAQPLNPDGMRSSHPSNPTIFNVSRAFWYLEFRCSLAISRPNATLSRTFLCGSKA